MHTNILQESTSLLKELNNLHRKANQGLRFNTTIKKPKTTQQLHSGTYNNISNINKNHKKQPSISPNNPITSTMSSSYTLLQERMNQLQSKLTAAKQSATHIGDTENNLPSSKKKTSPRVPTFT